MASTTLNPPIAPSVAPLFHQPEGTMDFAEYMDFERASDIKHHYYYGKVIEQRSG
jgi:hypothetical protein